MRDGTWYNTTLTGEQGRITLNDVLVTTTAPFNTTYVPTNPGEVWLSDAPWTTWIHPNEELVETQDDSMLDNADLTDLDEFLGEFKIRDGEAV